MGLDLTCGSELGHPRRLAIVFKPPINLIVFKQYVMSFEKNLKDFVIAIGVLSEVVPTPLHLIKYPTVPQYYT